MGATSKADSPLNNLLVHYHKHGAFKSERTINPPKESILPEKPMCKVQSRMLTSPASAITILLPCFAVKP
jgi:hypothetical protein